MEKQRPVDFIYEDLYVLDVSEFITGREGSRDTCRSTFGEVTVSQLLSEFSEIHEDYLECA